MKKLLYFYGSFFYFYKINLISAPFPEEKGTVYENKTCN